MYSHKTMPTRHVGILLHRPPDTGSTGCNYSVLHPLIRPIVAYNYPHPQEVASVTSRARFIFLCSTFNATKMSKSTNVVWHENHVSRSERNQLNGHKSCAVWLTGLSGSGKSTVSVHLERVLTNRGIRAYVLDGDNIRHGLNANLGFSAEDRTENIRRIGEVSKLFVDAGVIVIAAFISPYRADRDRVRSIMDDGSFVEVHVDASVEECEKRDVKGLYAKARAGDIPNFTGISAPFEEPLNPEVVVKTAEQSVEESTQTIVDYLESKGIIPKSS